MNLEREMMIRHRINWAAGNVKLSHAEDCKCKVCDGTWEREELIKAGVEIPTLR
jgi:hypothetical protein